MTTASITGTHTSENGKARRAVVPIGIATLVVAAAFSFGGRNSMGEWYFELGLQAVTALVVFGVVVPRGLAHDGAGGRGIAMGVLGLLLVVPAFWLGISVQLGAAAALLGYAGRRADTGSGRCLASLALGALTVAAYLSIYVSEFMAEHGVG
jgi:hypothetical protein